MAFDGTKRLTRAGRVRPGPVDAAAVRKRTEFIIKVATEEFLSQGYEGTTLASIANRCRISKSTVYDVFGSKEALFGHVAIASIADFSYDIQQALGGSRPFEDAIRDVVRLMVDTMRFKSRNLSRLVVCECERFPSVGRLTLKRTRELLRPLAQYLKDTSNDKRLTIEQASQFAFHLLSMAIGGFACLIVEADKVYGDTDAWVDSVVQVFVKSFPLGPPRPVASRR